MTQRIELLVERTKTSKWELARIGDRDVLRLHIEDGTQISFLTPEERVEFETLRASGVPRLTHPGLPNCIWNASRKAYVGKTEDEVRLSIVDVGSTYESEIFDQIQAIYERICARKTTITGEAADRIYSTYIKWVEGPPLSVGELATRFKWEAISLSTTSCTLWLNDGGVFAGHKIEVFVGDDGEVKDCSLAG